MRNTFTRLFYLLSVLIPASFFYTPDAEQEPESSPPVVAQTNPSCGCTITQGSFSSPLPTMATNSSAVNFYSYGNPVASSANTGLEISETMLIMIHEDLNTGNTSLVIILDKANDGTGGNASVTFNCLPGSAFVALSDDAGELAGGPPTITGNFNWAACCTDGGVIGGFNCGNTITISPNINSGISAFSLVYGTPTAPIYVGMPQLNCPITINCGGASCCNQAFQFNATKQNASCENTPNGSIDVSTTCATTPTFQWSNGATTEDVSGLLPGTYSVTITDANGCSQSSSYVIAYNSPSPQPSISGPTQFCAGDFVLLGVSGSFSSYQWSTGSTNSSILVNTPGSYSVTVSNAAGCTGTAVTTLTQNPLPVPNITGPTAVCLFNDVITINAGQGFSNYQWSTGETTPSIAVYQPGNYIVTVTNSFGCTGIGVTFISPLLNTVPMITGPNTVCPGSPITLNAGAGYSSYQWSTGAATQTINTGTQGTFTVTVTNDDGCIGTGSQQVTQGQVNNIQLFQTSCNPANVGVFVQQYVNQSGCDSTVTTTVTLSQSDSVYLSSQSCNPADTGVFVQHFTNQYGCDSVEIETVTLLASSSTSLTQYSCLPQNVGTVVQFLTNQYGCDSTVTITTFLLASDTTYLSAQSCDPDDAGVTQSLLVNSQGCDSLVITTTQFILVDTTYLSGTTCDAQLAGVFQNLFTGTNGCDSLVITTVSLLLSDTTYLVESTCDASQAGLTEQLLTNQNGCDSLVITNTSFVPPDTTLLFSSSCNPGDVGVFVNILPNVYGCDSLVITNTSLIPPDTTLLFSSSCNPGDVGVFVNILPNVYGCDSFLISTVSLLHSDTTFLYVTSCNPNQAGTVEVLLANQFGCDSLLIITTSYAEADSTFLHMTTCDPGEAGVAVEVFTSTDGCDSVVTTTTALLPSDTVQVFSTTCKPSEVGIVESLWSNQYGCDSLVITITTLLPSDTTFLNATTCDVNQAGLNQLLLVNQYGCDSLLLTSTAYVPPDTTFLFAHSCDPGDVGIEQLVLQNAFGCDSLLITTTSLLPSDTTVVQAFSCDPGQVGVVQVLYTNTFGCDSLVIIQTGQLPLDTTWLFFGSCSTMDTGLVVGQFVNQFGCDSLVFEQTSLLPAASCQINAQILGDTIGCTETTGSLWLTFLDGSPPYAYTWTDQNGNTGSGNLNQGGQPQAVSGLPPGFYIFEIMDPDGLMASLSAVVFQPDPLQIDPQISSDFNGYDISCFNTTDGSATVTVVDGGLPPYTFSWSNGSQNGQAIGLGAGWVSVTVTDEVGCVAVDSVFLESPDSLLFDFAETQPDCFTGALGAIAINQVSGGQAPYQFAINQKGWQPGPLFQDLPAGNYQVLVADVNGCQASSAAYLKPYTELFVYLGQDETIEFGDSVTLKPFILPFSLMDSIYWGGVDCPGCLQVTVVPGVTSTYTVTAVDSLGCRVSDELEVVVNKNLDVYIPNVFSPDNNGINDLFVIFGGSQLVRVRELQIFNRWGEAVFTHFNFPPNDLAFGWDGTHRGQRLDPAVFVYFALLEFLDGSTKLVKGDVTLMR